MPTTQTATLDQLDQLLPPLAFSSTRPSPATAPAPLESLQLYARANAALDARDAASAVDLLQKAIQLDPHSFALRYSLAEAYVLAGNDQAKALAALKDAEQLNPKHLELQTEIGRQYLNAGDVDSAVQHLRLATQTEDYRSDDELAALADYMLARALRLKGYDRAAIQMLEQLIDRLRQPSMSIRGNRDLLMLAQQPEALFNQMGELYERLGDLRQASVAFEVAADRRPENLAYQARLINALVSTGRSQVARKRASEVVKRFRASPESLRLLRDAYRGVDRDGRSQNAADAAVIVELRRLVNEKPDDRPLLFALVEMLSAQNRNAEATAILLDATRKADYDIECVRRLFALYKSQEKTVDASARLLIEAHARHADAQDELAPLWSDLMRRSWESRIRVGRLQELEVSPRAEAAKLFWVSQLAQMWNRDLLARSSLEQSALASPPFAPTYRLLIGRFWSRDDWDDARKVEESKKLIASAEQAGDAALAAELRGLLLLRTGEPQQAVDVLSRALDLGATAPQVSIAQAAALIRAGQAVRAEQLLWKLIEDHPVFEEAYNSLFTYYYQTGSTGPAARVLRAWRTADPASVNARLLEAMVLIQARQFAAAEALLEEMFASHADSPEVLASLRTLYDATGRIPELVEKLEAERQRRPDNRVALEYLIDIYVAQKQGNEASRVLQEVRNAVANDPDLLYYVGHLYTRIGREETTEQILAEVVKLDPTHAPASNDLGYTWADKGWNMERAEALIRVALTAEPDNQSYLDSLGWVLYKRSKFEEAASRLQEAIAPATFPDPVVLDHLGDALYRLDRKDDAIRQWRRSWEQLSRTDSDRADLRMLRTSLQKKLKDAEAGKPVATAPVVEERSAGL